MLDKQLESSAEKFAVSTKSVIIPTVQRVPSVLCANPSTTKCCALTSPGKIESPHEGGVTGSEAPEKTSTGLSDTTGSK